MPFQVNKYSGSSIPVYSSNEFFFVFFCFFCFFLRFSVFFPSCICGIFEIIFSNKVLALIKIIMLSTRSARKLFAIDIRGKLFNFPKGKNFNNRNRNNNRNKLSKNKFPIRYSCIEITNKQLVLHNDRRAVSRPKTLCFPSESITSKMRSFANSTSFFFENTNIHVIT